MLRGTMSRMVKRGKASAAVRLLLGEVEAVADRVDAIDEPRAGSNALPGPIRKSRR